MLRVENNNGVRQYVGRREVGLSSRIIGINDLIYKRLYSLFDQNRSDDDKFFIYSDYSGSKAQPDVGPTGAIFNLAFNPDGWISSIIFNTWMWQTNRDLSKPTYI